MPILIVAMALATAWADGVSLDMNKVPPRAGAIVEELATGTVSGRKDWQTKMMLVALASADRLGELGHDQLVSACWLWSQVINAFRTLPRVLEWSSFIGGCSDTLFGGGLVAF